MEVKMAFSFQKAKREQIWLKVLLAGPSGSGKTYTALRLAKGIISKSGGKVAAIDTENGRIRYYANEFDFDDLQLSAPYTPENYIEAINSAIDGGYNTLVIDSITHEWDYCLEVHSKMPGNSYTNWAKITPRHDPFMEKILQSPLHIIATVRGKDEYVMEEKNGKQVPKKVGLGYKQRDNTEYNYTCTFNIDQQTHVADAMKDNTHLFENKYDMLTEKDGMALYEWANSGDKPASKPVQTNTEKVEVTEVDALTKAKEDIKALVTSLASKKVSEADIKVAIKKHHTVANYNSIKDINIATSVLAELNSIVIPEQSEENGG
jgi:energy-coupling factor transporter ATP-binding protein EcfA2